MEQTVTSTTDLLPIVWATLVRAYLTRRMELELLDKPDKEVRIKGYQLRDWSTRLIGALDAEWQRIRTEM